MVSIKEIILISIEILVQAEAARILAFYPCPSISHQVVFRPITLELIRRGHQVTVITPDPMFPDGKAPQNLTEIDVHDLSYGIIRSERPKIITGTRADLIIQMKYLLNIFPKILEEQMKVQKVKEVILNQTEGYDLILLEALFTPALAIAHKYNVPAILISSFGPPPESRGIMGMSTHPMLYPNMARQRIYNLTLWEKLNEMYTQISILSYYNSLEEETDKMIKRIFWTDSPPLRDLRNYVDMLFVNLHPIWEGNYPVPPNVIYTGGLHQNPPKPLPKELQQYLDNSETGVIYFSFGSNVKPSLLPREKIAIFENVFSQLPYNVIWKWDNDKFGAKSSNVKITKWVPQSDLLRHPNIKAFITQGGLQSTDEAITAEVPLVGIPILGDQWFNVEKYVHFKIGVGLDFEHLTEGQLKNAILEVVENKSYKTNIARLHSLMRDQPQSPLERAVWWVEYSLRHGGARHLRAPSANISWPEFLQLDLIGLALFLLFTAIVSTMVITKYLISYLLSIERKQKLKKI